MKNVNIDFEEGKTGIDSPLEASNDAIMIHVAKDGKFLSRMVLFRLKDGRVKLLQYSDIISPMLMLGICTEE